MYPFNNHKKIIFLNNNNHREMESFKNLCYGTQMLCKRRQE